MPYPAAALPALPAGLEDKVPGISSFRTPNSSFYRVDTKLSVPSVDQNSWVLEVDEKVHIDRPSPQAMAQWSTTPSFGGLKSAQPQQHH